jgi:hypothetical protein
LIRALLIELLQPSASFVQGHSLPLSYRLKAKISVPFLF